MLAIFDEAVIFDSPIDRGQLVKRVFVLGIWAAACVCGLWCAGGCAHACSDSKQRSRRLPVGLDQAR
jgi:hypothetical protein